MLPDRKPWQIIGMFCSVPEHEPLFPVEARHMGYTPESSCLKQEDSCVVLRRRHRDREKQREIGYCSTHFTRLSILR